MRILKIEPFSGLSGDMFLGALLSIGGDENKLISLPRVLELSSVNVQVRRVQKRGIQSWKVDVVDESKPVRRHLSDILKIIDQSNLSAETKTLSRKIFHLLGEAESQVHQIPIEKIHFHEVGAIDSIIDVVGAAMLFVQLEITKTISLPVCTGYGFVQCEHGRMPVPTPATELLLHGFPTYRGTTESELVTPTGAAILKSLNPDFSSHTLITTKSGYGAGTKEFEHPNCLRLSLSESEPDQPETDIWILQSNLDDQPGELLGNHFMEKLIQEGALDVTITPVLMKKGRPGQMIEVLCKRQNLEQLSNTILEETFSLGVRYFPAERMVLQREVKIVETSYGKVRVKVATLPSGRIRSIPEYESCLELSKRHGLPFQEIYLETLRSK